MDNEKGFPSWRAWRRVPWALLVVLTGTYLGCDRRSPLDLVDHGTVQLAKKPGGGDGGGGTVANPEIAFVRDSDLRVVNVDGTNDALLFSSTFIWSAPSWGPMGDGTQGNPYELLFVEGCRNLYRMHVWIQNGTVVPGTPTPVSFTTESACAPQWSADGTQIAYVFHGLYVVPAEGGTSMLLYDPPGDHSDHYVGSASWSPDGTAIAIVQHEGGQPSVRIHNLLSGNTLVAVPSGLFPEMTTVAWSRTQQSKIAISVRKKVPGAWETWTVQVARDGTGDWSAVAPPTFLTAGANPSWSEDDGRIVTHDGRTLSIFDLNSGQTIRSVKGGQADWR